ncbi:MAG: toprim domain-containing protein [Acidobacteria bacterium]|nr:toprim domain-containing protein [Acidobacteriota bacterium]
MNDPIEAFKDCLEEHGLGRPDVIADGNLHRFDIPDDKRGRKSGWLVYHPDGIPSGAFGSWRSGESHKWFYRGLSALSPEEREKIRRRMVQDRWARQEAKQAELKAAQVRAHRIWAESEPEHGDHPYLIRKSVFSYGLRRRGNILVIPARNSDGELQTLAFIDPAGKKRFLAGGTKSGCAHLIGNPDGILPIGLAEGYATAASIHAATGFPMVVAFDAGNLSEAAKMIHRIHPEAPLIVFGDDDHETNGNPGRRKAENVLKSVVGRTLFPPDLMPGESDWNDLSRRIGPEALKALIKNLLAAKKDSPFAEIPKQQEKGFDEYGVETHRHGYYTATSTGVWMLREGRDGRVERHRLTNFTALITGRTFFDDGIEWNEQYEITCRCNGRQTIISLPSAQFSSLNWAYRMGPGAIVSAGLATRDQTRVAIQSLSLRETKENHIFVHTGWTTHKGQEIFLHSSGAIGPTGPVSGVRVELPEALTRYSFQEIPNKEETQISTKKVLHFLESGPPSNLYPLVAGTFRCVLGKVDFGIHLTGRTGSGKSELAARIQSFFGRRMDSRSLPGSWSSTSNFNERYAFLLKDCIFVVDDFAPEAGTNGVCLHRDAARLFRAIGNHAGRGRLHSDLSIRQARPPRCLVLSTGEDIPNGQSIRARLVLLEMDPPPMKGSSERYRISRIWAQCAEDAANGFYENCLTAFIQWVAQNHDRVFEQRARLARGFQRRFLQLGDHLRAPSAFAELASGFRIFLFFAQEFGVITDAESTRLWANAWEVFTSGVTAQADYQRTADPVDKFFELLSAILGSGRAHLAGPRGEMPENFTPWGWRMEMSGVRPLGERIGWVEGQNIYLEPSVAYDVIQKLAGDDRLPLSKETLWRRIRERGFLSSTTPNRGLKIRRILEGRQRDVLHLSAEKLYAEQDPRKLPCTSYSTNEPIFPEDSVSNSLSGFCNHREDSFQLQVGAMGSTGPDSPENPDVFVGVVG